jgi:hypothetical protein
MDIAMDELKPGTLLKLKYVVSDCIGVSLASEWIPARGDWKHKVYWLDDKILGWAYGADVEVI